MSRGIPVWVWVLGALVGLPAAAFGFASWRVSNPTHDPQALPDGLISIDSRVGRTLLADSEKTADYQPLVRWYVPQDKLSWCGVASATIVVNALGLNEPGPALRQPKLFTREARQVRSRVRTTWGGMTLQELAGILQTWDAHAEPFHAEEHDIVRFRMLARGNLGDPSDFLVVNYHRSKLGQAGAGHISPVAAWDQDTDRVLILDTASYRYPWTWVRIKDLFGAMNTQDRASGRSRGWLVVRSSR